ncbi:hypothetical protein [Jiangella aurantiaca]|nr:hypothetical protein [Jiangella aurantiaca]
MSGSIVESGESRSHIWSDSGAYDDTPLPYAPRVDMADLQEVRLAGP